MATRKTTDSSEMESGTTMGSINAESSPGDPKRLPPQNINITGGKDQHFPVQVMLTGSNDITSEALNCNQENVWSVLKKRPLAFNLINGKIKMLLLFNDKDKDAVKAQLGTNNAIYQKFRMAFPELMLPEHYSSLDGDSENRFENFLNRISQSNRKNAKLEYSVLKYYISSFVSMNYTQGDANFSHLESALGQEQLNYIQTMYEALNLEPPANVPVSMIELIWSYWMEEGMLVQTMNAISRRFQNMRNGDRDPLANFAIDPLRGASNLLWGYIQDANNRLTVQRRSYEYDNQYGLRLYGSAIPKSPSADSRSKFIGALNNLLLKCGAYYKQTDNLTIKADAFPILNSLQELHLVLAEGANNQFGNLPAEARIEMMVEQQILAREEIREFLNGRIMVPYKEEWMGRVDVMKKLQQWDSTGITHFYDLANYSEILILSIRYVNWIDVNSSETAGTWAVFFRNEIQKYIFSYRAVTGVDLSTENSSTTEERNTIPGILIQQRRNKR
ncbi:hypothetical protein BH11BAC7_BH11BAC7_04470 [soil metagenome]